MPKQFRKPAPDVFIIARVSILPTNPRPEAFGSDRGAGFEDPNHQAPQQIAQPRQTRVVRRFDQRLCAASKHVEECDELSSLKVEEQLPTDVPHGESIRLAPRGAEGPGKAAQAPAAVAGVIWLADGSCIRLRAAHRNHVWSYDFMEDRTHDGRKYRMLNIVDEFTRECLAIRIARRLRSMDVIELLAELFLVRGVPGYIRSDNGPEFVAKAVQGWLAAGGRPNRLHHSRQPVGARSRRGARKQPAARQRPPAALPRPDEVLLTGPPARPIGRPARAPGMPDSIDAPRKASSLRSSELDPVSRAAPGCQPTNPGSNVFETRCTSA